VLRIDDGNLYKNNGTRNDDYICFGVPVRSVSDGEVIGVRNDMPDGIPTSKQPANVKTPSTTEEILFTFAFVRIFTLFTHISSREPSR